MADEASPALLASGDLSAAVVVSAAANRDVRAIVAEKKVHSALAAQHVGPAAAADHVVTVEPGHHVRSIERSDHVVAVCPSQDVGAAGTHDRGDRACAEDWFGRISGRGDSTEQEHGHGTDEGCTPAITSHGRNRTSCTTRLRFS